MKANEFVVPKERFNNQSYIEERASLVPLEARGAIRTALSYLYLTQGPLNLPRDRMKIVENLVEPRERLLLRWLFTRTNGSLRSTYGHRALGAARASRFRCKSCGFGDVRALHIDHVNGRVEDGEFACLCANCHNIKSREKDWSGKRR